MIFPIYKMEDVAKEGRERETMEKILDKLLLAVKTFQASTRSVSDVMTM
jgi:hypothetical protein